MAIPAPAAEPSSSRGFRSTDPSKRQMHASCRPRFVGRLTSFQEDHAVERLFQKECDNFDDQVDEAGLGMCASVKSMILRDTARASFTASSRGAMDRHNTVEKMRAVSVSERLAAENTKLLDSRRATPTDDVDDPEF